MAIIIDKKPDFAAADVLELLGLTAGSTLKEQTGRDWDVHILVTSVAQPDDGSLSTMFASTMEQMQALELCLDVLTKIAEHALQQSKSDKTDN